MMDLEVTVNARGQYWNGGAMVAVPDPMRYVFEPIKTTDDAMMAFATGEDMVRSEAVQKKMEVRKDAAEYLAKEIAELLVNEMSKNDTHNGY